MAFVAEFLASKFLSVRGFYALRRGSQALVNRDYPKAINAFREAVETKAEIFGTGRHLPVAQAMVELANAHRLNSECKEAAEVLPYFIL